MNWNIDHTHYPEVAGYVESIERNEPEFLSYQMRVLVVMASSHLPEMTIEEATLLVNAFRGKKFSRPELIPSSYLPGFIAEYVTAGVMAGSEALPFLPEFDAAFDEAKAINPGFQSEEVRFARHLASTLDPFQAYLLLVMIECFWLDRKYSETTPPNFGQFFNIKGA